MFQYNPVAMQMAQMNPVQPMNRPQIGPQAPQIVPGLNQPQPQQDASAGMPGMMGGQQKKPGGQDVIGQANTKLNTMTGMNAQLLAGGHDPLSFMQQVGGAMGFNDYATPGAPLPGGIQGPSLPPEALQGLLGNQFAQNAQNTGAYAGLLGMFGL